MKKFTTLLLVLALTLSTILSAIPTGIFADSVTEITDNSGYGGGIRKKSDGSILFSPYIAPLTELISGGANISDYTIDMTFTLLDGKDGSAVHTFDTVSAAINASDSSYYDIYLNGAKGNCGFCPTAEAWYDIYVEIYQNRTADAKGTKVMQGTYQSMQAASDIAGSSYYVPTAVPVSVPQITETTEGYTGSITYKEEGIRKRGSGQISFCPYITELRNMIPSGQTPAGYTAELTFTLLEGKDGQALYTFDTISLTPENGTGYFYLTLADSNGNHGFIPTAGKYYDIKVEIYNSNQEKILAGTYKSIPAAASIAGSEYYTPTEIPVSVPQITETTEGYTGSITYKEEGIRKRSSGQISFCPYITELRNMIPSGQTPAGYTAELTFTLLEGKDGQALYTFDTISLTPENGTGYFYLTLADSNGNHGFIPTAGKYYDIKVEIYNSNQEKILAGTYKSIPAAASIAGSEYYTPTEIPVSVPQITETTEGYTGSITYKEEGIRKRGSGQISFCPYITELRDLISAGANLSDYKVYLTFTQLELKDGAAVHTFDTISLTPENGTGYFYLTLADSNGNCGFIPTAGEYYDIEVKIYDSSNALVTYGTYKSIPAAKSIADSEYYAPTPKTIQITETKDGYTGQQFYKNGIRKNSSGAIMASAFITELRTQINAGKSYDQYTIKAVFTLLDEEGKEVVSFPEVTLQPKSSNGQYFDIPLKDSGFIPTAGAHYKISMDIYEDGVLKFYGTYQDIVALDTIAESPEYLPTPVPGAPVEYDISLSYSFNNVLAGSAAGKIFFSVDKAGYFELTWGDADGKPLTTIAGGKTLTYSELVKFNVTSKTGGSYAEKVIGFTAIPQGAKTLIVLDSTGNVLKTLELPQNKLQSSDGYSFSFGAISDLHYEYFYTNGVDDAIYAVDTALAFYEAAGAKLVVATGDYSKYTEEAAYQKYQTAVNKVSIPVIACGGNHEVYTISGDVMFGEGGYWRTYMNNSVYDGTLAGVLNIAENGVDFAYSYPGLEDYVFLSLSQWKWDGHATTQDCLVTDSQLTWLADMLETYKDKTVYLLFHTYLGDDDYESFDGEGDMINPGGYTYGGYYNQYTADEKVFRNLLDQYENVIWFNGHSHYEYSIQKYNENLNIFDYMGTTATMIHVPSVTNARTITDSASSYSNTHGTMSQGALMFVYDGYQIMNGVDLWEEEILSYACYIVYDDKSEIVEEGTIEGTDITWTWDAQLNSLRILGTGTMPDFGVENSAPWAKYLADVMTVYVGKGIARVGANAFNGASKLETVEMKNDVAEIGKNAFAATSISKLILPEALVKVEDSAFAGISAIDTIIYAGSKASFDKILIAGGNAALTTGTISYQKYTVIWDVNGKQTSEEVKVGKQPVYEGLPAKEHEDPSKHYVFTGWSDGTTSYTADKLPKMTGDVTYTAVFGDVVDRYIVGFIADNTINWTVDRTTGTLTISGVGAMPNWTIEDARPWSLYNKDIVKVVVKKGITTVGAYAFSQMSALQTVIIEEGVTALNSDAMSYNSTLTSVTLPGTLTWIGQGVVYQSNNLKTVYAGFATAKDFEALWSKYAYNTAFGGAEYYTTAIAFAGHQLGNNAIRFVGTASAVAVEKYDKVALKVEVAGKTIILPTGAVFTTLKGIVNNELLNVVTTATSDDEAMFVLEADYLYGLAILNIPEGTYDFTITPIAYIGDTEIYGKTVTLSSEIKSGVIENTESAPYYKLSNTLVKMDVGNTFDIRNIATANAAAKVIMYVSSDPSVATVDENGVITAVADGSTAITVTATNGTKSTTAVLTVFVSTPWTPDNVIDGEVYNATTSLGQLKTFAWYDGLDVTKIYDGKYNIRNLTSSAMGPVEIWSDTLQIDFTIEKNDLNITAKGTDFDIYFKEAGSEEMGGYDKATIHCWSAYDAGAYYIYRCTFAELAAKMVEGTTYDMVIVVRSGSTSLAYVKTQLTWTDSCQSFVEYAAVHDEVKK